MLALVLVGGDFVVGVVVLTGYSHTGGIMDFLSAIFEWFVVTNASIGFYFHIQATRLRMLLVRYLRMRQELSTARSVSINTDPMARTTYILFINGSYLTLLALLEVSGTIEVANGLPNPELFFGLFGAYALMRTRSEYWHVSFFVLNKCKIFRSWWYTNSPRSLNSSIWVKNLQAKRAVLDSTEKLLLQRWMRFCL